MSDKRQWAIDKAVASGLARSTEELLALADRFLAYVEPLPPDPGTAEFDGEELAAATLAAIEAAKFSRLGDIKKLPPADLLKAVGPKAMNDLIQRKLYEGKAP